MELRKVANRDEAVRLLGQAAASGTERAVWARQNGINPRSLNLSRAILTRDHSVRAPRPLRLMELVAAAPRVANASVRVRCEGLVVEVDPDFEEVILGRVLAAVVRC